LPSEQAHILSCCIDIVAEGLPAERSLASRGKQVSRSHPGEVGSNQVNGNTLFDRLFRLLIISLSTKPTGKVL
jgi:hypothetical protein